MPKSKKATVQVTIRVPCDWLERADNIAADLSPIGKKLTRMDGFRAAMVFGFEHHETMGSFRR
jgi:hypothetical protein